MKTLWRKTRKLARLPAERRRRFLTSAFALTFCSLGLRLLGYNRFHGLLRRSSRRELAPAPPPKTVAHAWTEAVRHAAFYVPLRTLCFERSLALWWLLARRGFEPKLRIGVQRRDSQILAHAWIELGGEVLNDTEDVAQRFTPFDGEILPAGASRT